MPYKSIDEVLEYLGEIESEALYPTDLKEAIIGVVERFGQPPLVLLDREKCIEILVKRDDMTEEEAEEFFEFNTIGAWIGEGTPCFATLIKKPIPIPDHKPVIKLLPETKLLDCRGVDSDSATGKSDCTHPFVYREYIGQTPGRCSTCKRIVP